MKIVISISLLLALLIHGFGQVTNLESLNIVANYEIIYPTSKDGTHLLSSEFENQYLCNNEPFQIVTEYQDFTVTSINTEAAYPHKTKFENAILVHRKLRVFEENEKLGLVTEQGEILLNSEFDDLFVYGDFNQIIVAVKDERALVFNGKLEPLEEEIIYLVHKAKYDEAPVFLKEFENGKNQILIFSNIGETVFAIDLGSEKIQVEVHDLWGDHQFFIFNWKSECYAIDLYEPKKGIVANGVNMRHLFTVLDQYTD